MATNKKIFLYMIRNTAIIYTCVYLITCFVTWQIRNPFQWIINLPNYDGETRFMILFFWAMYSVFNFVLTDGHLRIKELEKQ